MVTGLYTADIWKCTYIIIILDYLQICACKLRKSMEFGRPKTLVDLR